MYAIRSYYVYRDLPGQWNGIWIAEGALSCEIHNGILENANLGIQVDKPAEFDVPQLIITDTKIRNMSLGGIAGNATWIEGVNISISGCGSYALALNGGKFNFVITSYSIHYTKLYECQLQKIYVLKDFLSLKIGFELQNRLITKAKDDGFERIWLSVLESNERAIRFRNNFV